MDKNNNHRNQITSILILAVMIVCGASMLVPSYLATRSKLILIFAVIWIGTLLLVMIRTILGVIKSKKNMLDDMQQYYEQQEKSTVHDIMPVAQINKAACIKQIITAIIMMVLGGCVIMPSLIASNNLLFALLIGLWYYALLIHKIVRNVKKLKNIESDPIDMQQVVQSNAVPPATQLQRKMVACPYCGEESPENFMSCCHCGRKR